VLTEKDAVLEAIAPPAPLQVRVRETSGGMALFVGKAREPEREGGFHQIGGFVPRLVEPAQDTAPLTLQLIAAGEPPETSFEAVREITGVVLVAGAGG